MLFIDKDFKALCLMKESSFKNSNIFLNAIKTAFVSFLLLFEDLVSKITHLAKHSAKGNIKKYC